MLKIKNVSKSYNKNIKALDNVSLTVDLGQIYGFVGHNGAGKTTLIKAITGIHEFETGDITINNISIKKDPIACKKIMAYIPDNPDIYESLTGIEYLNFMADVYEIDIKTRQQKIDKYTKVFELDEVNNQISSYSHGMKQKLVLIGAFMHSPKLMVLDEPFVGLDPTASFALKKTMKEVCAEGTSIFLSSHVLEVVEKLCDEISIIKDGKIVISGPTKKILGDKTLESIFMEINNE